MTRHKIYIRWYCIVRRCNDPSDKRYRKYGARGIRCEWTTFPAFLKWWLQNAPSESGEVLDIHRIDSDGPYSPENCVIMPHSEHAELHWRDPEFRARHSSAQSAAAKAIWQRPGLRLRVSLRIQELWRDPEFRKKNLAARVGGKMKRQRRK